MARSSPLAPESLLAHDDFVRRLARQLLRDAATADDIGQQAWLAVLQRPAAAGGEPQSWRAFLATLVRRLCQRQQRRERREQARRAVVAAAHDGASPSVAALHAREAQRTRVVQAVLALPEPYRDVVVLRWFEGLPPRAIARRLALPVETVRTRHKRALAQLARTLDGEAGDRAAWALPLAALARPEAPAAAGVWFLPGVLLMSLQTKLVASFLVVVAALLCFAWPLWSSPPDAGPKAPGTPPANATAAAASGVADPSAATAQAATPSPTERTAAPSADAAAALASLQVTVRYADEQPAADVLVLLHRSGDDDPRTQRPRARTDARGVVQFAGLAPGRVFATVARGGWQWGDGVGLEAGRRSEVVVRLARGMDLRGVVVDSADRPVAGATIVASSWGGSDVEELGTSGADGTFALRAIATHCHVGAYGAGFAPSPLRQFTASDGAVVDTRIVLTAPAAALRGTVVDGGGQVVSGAIVRAGDFEQRNSALPDGGQAMGWRPQTTRSDAQGRFEFASLPAERLPLQVTAEGHAPWHQPVDVVAGRANEVAVVLGPGASVHGCVRDALGQPVARAELELGEWSQPGHRRTRTRDDGTFVFDDVLPGEIVASAAAETRGRCKATLQLASGQRTRWDPVLQAGRLLRGRVQSRTGTPISGVMVIGTAPHPARSSGTRWRTPTPRGGSSSPIVRTGRCGSNCCARARFPNWSSTHRRRPPTNGC